MNATETLDAPEATDLAGDIRKCCVCNAPLEADESRSQCQDCEALARQLSATHAESSDGRACPNAVRRQRDSDGIAFALAFSEGADARLAARPLTDCPYRVLADQNRWRAWRSGWLDVSHCWGAMVRGRWAYRPLPAMGRSEVA
jgi:hypothetical protein